jgi:nucleobase:cation symporter-1, NCS1 family
MVLNIPDFTRYAKSRRAQAFGQALGLLTAMTLYSSIGVAVTSASVRLFGQSIWVCVAKTTLRHELSSLQSRP